MQTTFFINLSVSSMFISAIIVCEEALDLTAGSVSLPEHFNAGHPGSDVKETLHLALYITFLSYFLNMLLIIADRLAVYMYALPSPCRMYSTDESAKTCVAISWMTTGCMFVVLILYSELVNPFDCNEVFTAFILPIINGSYLVFGTCTYILYGYMQNLRNPVSSIWHHFHHSSVFIGVLLITSSIACNAIPTLVILFVKQKLIIEYPLLDIIKFLYAVEFLVDAVICICVHPTPRRMLLRKLCGKMCEKRPERPYLWTAMPLIMMGKLPEHLQTYEMLNISITPTSKGGSHTGSQRR